MHWLDKIIAEQAAHYGMTVEQHARLMGGAADCQGLIDRGELDEQQVRDYVELDEAVSALLRKGAA